MRGIVINTRVLATAGTGLQRYVAELVSRFPGEHSEVAPKQELGLLASHLWEQVILPTRIGQRNLLFSPANTGPLFKKHQVVTIHDVVTLDKPEWFSHAKTALYRTITPRLARNATRIITISKYTKQRLLAHVPMDERRVEVIPNGVDRRFSPQAEEAVRRMRARLELPDGRYVLSVGTLEPRKNIPRLLNAWARIVDKVPDDIWLVLTGKQGQAEVFARQFGLKNLPPRLYLTGHVADELLPALYAGALVFVFPSLYEGFGLPPLEAMASGVPVVTCNRTSLPEVVGDAGVMVDPHDVDAIAEGLKRLIEDDALRADLREKGLKRAALFSWDKTARKTWNVLQKVATS